MLTVLKHGLNLPDDEVYLVEGLLDLADLGQLAALPRPDLKHEPWLASRACAPPRARRGAESSSRSSAATCSSTTRTTRSRGSRGLRPRRPRRTATSLALKTTVYRTSDESPLDPGADRGGRGGQADRLPRRAEGPLRRAPQHRVVAGAGAGRRPRRLRLPEPEDPRQDDAGRAPRGRRAAPLRAHRHRQLPLVTARLYEDFGLFTADPDISADVADLFNYLTGFGRPQRLRKLLAAPFDLRERLIERDPHGRRRGAAKASRRASASR